MPPRQIFVLVQEPGYWGIRVWLLFSDRALREGAHNQVNDT